MINCYPSRLFVTPLLPFVLVIRVTCFVVVKSPLYGICYPCYPSFSSSSSSNNNIHIAYIRYSARSALGAWGRRSPTYRTFCFSLEFKGNKGNSFFRAFFVGFYE